MSQQCLSEVRESTGKAVAEMAFAVGAVEWLERLCTGTVAVAAGKAPPRAFGAAGAAPPADAPVVRARYTRRNSACN